MRTTVFTQLCLLLLLCTSARAQNVDWNSFAAAAETKASTPKELAEKITEGLTTDIDKAAVIFYWVTQNIAYDTKLYGKIATGKKSKPKSYSPAEVAQIYEERVTGTMKNRKGVCDGYSRLYQRLANLSGLECELVAGYARGNIMAPGSLGIGHAWNAVKIDDEWQLVDCTWGAGVVNDKMKYVPKFTPAYFMTRPESMSYNHYPNEPKWQLLEAPVNQEVYLERTAIGGGFLRYGLYDLSHREYRLETKRRKPLVIGFNSTTVPEELLCVNYTSRQQIPCTVSKKDNHISINLPGSSVNNMVLGIVTPDKELLLSYRVVGK
jgi:hypothetical protein